MLFFLIEIIFLFPIFVNGETKNNACKNYESYLKSQNNPKCFYIPDNNDDVLEITRRHTEVGETHKIRTEDGYIIRIFRIPQKNAKNVVLLQHGIFFDARLWLAQYNESVALEFWKAGYEVWLGNFRGNLYGKEHVRLTPKDESFWNFTFHEMGYYDLHAMTEYIKKITNRSQILFVGYSMGGATGLVYASLRPQEARSIKVMVALAPATNFKYATTPLKYTIWPIGHFLVKYKVDKMFKWHSFPRYHSWYLKLVRYLNEMSPFKKIVALTLSFIGGGPLSQKDPLLMNLFVDQTGSASSWKTFDHYYQLNYDPNGTFRRYDYGKTSNLKTYGTEEAPLYPLENIQIPVYIIHSQDDIAIAAGDMENLYSLLPEKAKIYGKKKVEGLGHFDYFYGKDRNEKTHKHIIQLFDNIGNN